MQFTKSDHYQKVEAFMVMARQSTPQFPMEPSKETRILRAKLILEEALETLAALGVQANLFYDGDRISIENGNLFFEVLSDFDLEGTIDGCCDLKVVTTGTLVACGIPDTAFQDAVDDNNLEKFGPGHQIRPDGKLVKPPGHKPPDIGGLISDLKRKCENA